jgi:glycosyltransferase involved in cell wall biosynthesis
VHNVYPLLSPSVLVACRDSGIPVVFSVHSQILTCPTWYHFLDGAVCERCVGGKEYHCVLRNCRGNLVESSVYALRSAFARKRDIFRLNTTLFLTMSRFMKDRLAATGIPPERIALAPNMVRPPTKLTQPKLGAYVGFAGRLSAEKGIPVLLEAARNLPLIPFRIAGSGPMFDSLLKAAPPNVHFDGLLDRNELSIFYNNARVVVVPSISFETSSLVALEAMAHGLPVIGSRIGALPEVVLEGVTGRLFDTGKAEQLAHCISDLWDDPGQLEAMGAAGRQLVRKEHSPAKFLARTLKTYEKAVALHKRNAGVACES